MAAGLGAICGLAPALQFARVDPQVALRTGTCTAGRSGLRNALMGVQVALALIVLMAAGPVLRSLTETRETAPDSRARACCWRLTIGNIVTPDYFTMMGVPVRAGSTFTDLADAKTPPQAVVNEEFVRRYLDGGVAAGVTAHAVTTRTRRLRS